MHCTLYKTGLGQKNYCRNGRLRPVAGRSNELSKLEGIIPAIDPHMPLPFCGEKPENSNQKSGVVINLSGRGDKDLDTYIIFKLVKPLKHSKPIVRNEKK